AFRAAHADAVRLHRPQMRAAREQRDVLARAVHVRAQIRADGARAGDQKLHFGFPASAAAIARRSILPVAVREIFSTMYSVRGHLNSARRSRQYGRLAALSAGERSPTAAATSSPHVGWGTPNATASA